MDPIHPLDAPPGHRAGRVWEPHRGHAIGAPILINWVAVGRVVGCRSPRTAARNVAEGVAVAPSLAMAEMLARPGMRAGTRLLAWLALPSWPVFPGAPGADCAVTVQRVPGCRECGGFCRDLLPRALRKKRWDPSAGATASAFVRLTGFYLKG